MILGGILKRVVQPEKVELCLTLMLDKVEINTFDANAAYGDTCLHSLVSGLQRTYDITIQRELRKVESCRSNAAIAHYRVTGEDRIKAKQIVNKKRVERGLEAIYLEVPYG